MTHPSVERISGLLEQRVGPHGYIHGWIKVNAAGNYDNATSTKKVANAIGVSHHKHARHSAFASEHERLKGPASNAPDSLLHANFTEGLLRAKDAQKKGQSAAAAKHLATAVTAEAELRHRGKTPMFGNREVRYNDAPLSTSTTDNWVARHGGLPPFARAIARALERSGHSESSAIATAIAALKRWAAGGGNVHASTRARSAAAVAHWEALKAAAHATPNKRDEDDDLEHRFNPKQPRSPAGTVTGGQWAAQGGQSPSKVNHSKVFRDWHARQIGHYPAGMTDPKARQQWDDWFRFFSLTLAQQRALIQSGQAPKKPKGAPRGPRKHRQAEAILERRAAAG